MDRTSSVPRSTTGVQSQTRQVTYFIRSKDGIRKTKERWNGNEIPAQFALVHGKKSRDGVIKPWPLGLRVSDSAEQSRSHSCTLHLYFRGVLLALQPPVLARTGKMFVTLQPGGPQIQCLPPLAQLANATACPAWRRTVPGACELTSLRNWSPFSAAPSPVPPSRRSKISRRAVLTGATVDVPEWDVVALGQSMVDISAYVDDPFIEQMGVAKGGRR